MKKTTREFGECIKCKGNGFIAKTLNSLGGQICGLCQGNGGMLIKETIEESDDMKEFIEKKCGWELCEGKKERLLSRDEGCVEALKNGFSTTNTYTNNEF